MEVDTAEAIQVVEPPLWLLRVSVQQQSMMPPENCLPSSYLAVLVRHVGGRLSCSGILDSSGDDLKVQSNPWLDRGSRAPRHVSFVRCLVIPSCQRSLILSFSH